MQGRAENERVLSNFKIDIPDFNQQATLPSASPVDGDILGTLHYENEIAKIPKIALKPKIPA